MRFTLCWNTAVIFPMNKVARSNELPPATASWRVLFQMQLSNNLKKATNEAALTTVAINAVNTVGDPSYTSGVQKWKGTALTLNEMAINKNTNPIAIMGLKSCYAKIDRLYVKRTGGSI